MPPARSAGIKARRLAERRGSAGAALCQGTAAFGKRRRLRRPRWRRLHCTASVLNATETLESGETAASVFYHNTKVSLKKQGVRVRVGENAGASPAPQ